MSSSQKRLIQMHVKYNLNIDYICLFNHTLHLFSRNNLRMGLNLFCALVENESFMTNCGFS